MRCARPLHNLYDCCYTAGCGEDKYSDIKVMKGTYSEVCSCLLLYGWLIQAQFPCAKQQAINW